MKDGKGVVEVQLGYSSYGGWTKEVKNMNIAKAEVTKLVKELEKINKYDYESEDDEYEDVMDLVKNIN